MRTMIGSVFLTLLLASGGVAISSLHRSNARLRTKVAAAEASPAAVAARRADRQPAVAAPPPVAVPVSPERVRLDQLRTEVAAAERKAAAEYAAHPEPTDAPETNRDPERGMTRLENLHDVGQATPAAALQTLFWAAMKGQDAAMARTIAWDEAVRPDVASLVGQLSPDLRARYPTPEALAALVISRHALEVSAIHITATTPENESHATLTVQGLTGGDETLPMRRGPDGWQLLAGKAMLDTLRDQLGGKK